MTHPSIVFLNGNFLTAAYAAIPISDRGFLFGDGIFTTLKVKDGKIQFFMRHMQALQKQCNAIGITPPLIIIETLHELIARNQAEKNVWRLKVIVTGGNIAGLALGARPSGQLLMMMQPYQEEVSSYRLAIFPEPIARPFAHIKSLAYLDRLAVMDYALQQGCDDALVTDAQGNLLETAFSNIFWYQNQHLYMPAPNLPFFCGVTLQVVAAIGQEKGITIHEVQNCLDQVRADAQVYVCNALKGIVPVTSVGQRLFTRDLFFENMLKSAYQKMVDQEI